MRVRAHNVRQRPRLELLAPEFFACGGVESEDCKLLLPDHPRGKDTALSDYRRGDPLSDVRRPEDFVAVGELEGQVPAFLGYTRCVGTAELRPIFAGRRDHRE